MLDATVSNGQEIEKQTHREIALGQEFPQRRILANQVVEMAVCQRHSMRTGA
jgi:hypothetical protein